MAYSKTNLLENLPNDVYWTLLELATQGVWRWDIKADRIRWSEKLQRTLKTKSDEAGDIKLANIIDITHPDDAAVHQRAIEEQLLTTGKYDIKIRLQTPDNHYIQCHILGTTIFDRQGAPETALGFILDNTREYNLIQSMIEKNDIFTTFMNKCPGAVFLKNEHGQHVYVNEVTAQVVGKSKDEIIGKTAHEILPQTVADQLAEIDRKVFASQSMMTWQGEVNGTENGGEKRYVYDIKFPVNIGENIKLLGGFGFDVTELQKSRETIANIQKMESVGRLAGGIAHDFNNMMGIIQGHTEIARLNIDNSPQVIASLQKIETAIQRSSEMVHKLLGFARKQPVSPRLFELNEGINDTLDLIRPLIGENIQLSRRFSDQPLPLQYDESQFTQILTNLCVNARDAIVDQGCITIQTQTKQLSIEEQQRFGLASGSYALITVADNGHGIPPGQLSNIFEPFYTSKPGGKGTGLGLSTVYGIVKQNAGHIEASSTPGKGSCFSLYLKLSDSQPTPELSPQNSEAPQAHARVLLVEDDAELLAVTSELLSANGCDPIATQSPLEALRLFAELKDELDILITDITMPEMSGIELIEKIRLISTDIPVVITTGYNDNVEAKVRRLPNIRLLVKPISMQTLKNTLSACLKK